MSAQRRFRGIWIPAHIWESEDLSIMEKVMLAEIDSLSGNGNCFASNEYFSKFFQVSIRQIQRTISSLVEKGYLINDYSKNSQGYSQRILYLAKGDDKYVRGDDKNVTPPLTKMSPPPMTEMSPIYHSIDNKVIEGKETIVSNASPKTSKKFKTPTTDEVLEYFLSYGDGKQKPEFLKKESLKFYSYYESNGWQVGKNKMKNWKAAVRSWLLKSESYGKHKSSDTKPSKFDTGNTRQSYSNQSW